MIYEEEKYKEIIPLIMDPIYKSQVSSRQQTQDRLQQRWTLREEKKRKEKRREEKKEKKRKEKKEKKRLDGANVLLIE